VSTNPGDTQIYMALEEPTFEYSGCKILSSSKIFDESYLFLDLFVFQGFTQLPMTLSKDEGHFCCFIPL